MGVNAKERLRVTVERLEANRATVADELVAMWRRQNPTAGLAGLPPFPVEWFKDTNGRFLLLDADIAIVNALTALANADG